MQLTKSATHTPGEANSSSASQILHIRYYFNKGHATTITIMKRFLTHKSMLLY